MVMLTCVDWNARGFCPCAESLLGSAPLLFSPLAPCPSLAPWHRETLLPELHSPRLCGYRTRAGRQSRWEAHHNLNIKHSVFLHLQSTALKCYTHILKTTADLNTAVSPCVSVPSLIHCSICFMLLLRTCFSYLAVTQSQVQGQN